MNKNVRTGMIARVAPALLPLAFVAAGPALAGRTSNTMSVSAIVQPSCAASAVPERSAAAKGDAVDAVTVICSSGGSWSATADRETTSPTTLIEASAPAGALSGLAAPSHGDADPAWTPEQAAAERGRNFAGDDRARIIRITIFY